MSTKRIAIRGGYRFKSFAGKPAEELITLSTPDRVTVVIPPELDSALAVEQGETVKAGQIIARNDESISSPVHAPIGGPVASIGSIDYFGTKARAVVIDTDNSEEISLLDGASEEWENLAADTLERLVYLSGAGAIDPSGIPTSYKSAAAKNDAVTDIIINCVEANLFPASTALVIKEMGVGSFADGCKMLAKIMPNAKLHVVMNRERADLLADLSDQLPGASTYAVKPEYPAERDEVLVSTVLKKPFPYGFSAAHAGVIVVSARTVAHVYEAVTTGLPVVERILPVGGTGVSSPTHVRVRLGSSTSTVLDGAGGEVGDTRLVVDSLLSGSIIEKRDVPVQRDWKGVFAITDSQPTELIPFALPGFRKDSYTNTFAAVALPWISKRYDTNLRGEQRACLSCSYCAEVCPVGILPNLLHKYAEREIIEEDLIRYRIFDCIDCNLCSYVCPSKIPVAALMKKGKDMLEAEGISNIPRVRLEFGIEDQGAAQ